MMIHQRPLIGLFTMLLCGLPLSAPAQDDFGQLFGKKTAKKPPKAIVTATVEPAEVALGATVVVQVAVTPPEGYYIYGTDGKFGGRTRITLKGDLQPLGDGFQPDQPGKTAVDPDLNEEVTKHHGPVVWSRKFRLPVAVSDDGPLAITGQIEGQYCSGPEDGGLCITLREPLNLSVTLASTTPAAADSSYDEAFRPIRGGKPDPIEFFVDLAPRDAKAGDTVTLSITATPDADWHTYALKQTAKNAAPTVLNIERMMNLTPIDAEFTPNVLPVEEIGPEQQQLLVYHGPVTWTRKFRVTEEAAAGQYVAGGTIEYQVCTGNRCLPIKVAEFAVGQPAPAIAADPPSPFGAVEVEPEPPKPAKVAGPAADPDQKVAAAPVAAAKPQDRGLIPFLLLCVGGGFLALLTPCSFPMVPITVSFFLKQAEKEHRAPALLALVYCGTIVLTFTVLGVGIAAVFGAAQLNALANNGPLNVVIALVFIAFALNMLGVFEIHVPSNLLTWTATHSSGGSYLGAIFMALTFTLTSFTCTFAVAGSLLAAAAQGDITWPVLGMLAFGVAFASPFFILAMIPSLLKKIPKSGGWMNAVKVVMGLIEIGAAVKFLSIADITINRQPILFDYATVMLVWLVLSITIALYLFETFRFAHDTPSNGISVGRGLFAMAFLGLASMLGFLLLQPDRAQGWVMDSIVSFAPPRFDDHGAGAVAVEHAPPANEELGPTTVHQGLRFALDLEKAVVVARREGKPLFLDFTGVNCVNCRRMEKKMAEPANRERLGRFVTVQLYVDVMTPEIRDNAEADRLLQMNRKLQDELLNDASMPGYAIVMPDGKTVLASFIGFDQRNEFTRFLDAGWERFQAQRVAAKP